MYEVWLKNKGAENDDNYDEYSAVKRAFDNFEQLGFVGGALRVAGRIEAFTMGEALTDETFCTHIEKANTDPHTTPQALWCRAPNTGQSTRASMPSAPPTMCVIILHSSSPRV